MTITNTDAQQLLQALVEEFVLAGIEVTISYHAEYGFVYDLNVAFKSGIKLTIVGDYVYALQRYENRDLIEEMSDVLWVHCRWWKDTAYRGWNGGDKVPLPSEWEKLYVKHGIIKVKEVTTTHKEYTYV